jgi:hypothetical protein
VSNPKLFKVTIDAAASDGNGSHRPAIECQPRRAEILCLASCGELLAVV